MLLAESTYDISRELKMDPRINISWGDWMTEEDNKRRDYFLDLSNEEWTAVVDKHLAAHKDNVQPALAWVQRVGRTRAARAEARAMDRIHEEKTELDIAFGAWKDMIEEPWRYGDNDWAEWLELDEQLRNSPKRWRVEAFWQKKQDEVDEESRKAFVQMLVDAKTRFDNRMATRIQAAWRGHQLRDTHPQLNCNKCLTHKPAQYKCEDGAYACMGCVVESFKWSDDDKVAIKCLGCGTPWTADWPKVNYCDEDCELSAMKEDLRYGGGW